VATDPEYRRKGLMAQLLNYTVKKITQEGYHLSVLWGDRQRYNYFGWEIAGRGFTFRITRRSLEKFVSTQVIPSIRVKRYQGDQQEMNDVIVFHHEKEPLRVERSQQEYQLFLEKTGVVSYIAFGEGTSNRDKSAYFIFRGENVPTEVLEFGGEPLIFLGLLRYIFSKFEIASLDFPVPYYSTTHPSTSSLFPYLLEIASSWFVNPFCQVKIIDLYSTLGVLLPIIQEKLRSSGILSRNKELNITLKMSESGQKATLVFRGDKIEVTNRQSPTTVEITELKMVKLLFGTFPTAMDLKLEPDYSQFLETIFPIDFYIWPLDHI
jgi:predicted acetyltransferase